MGTVQDKLHLPGFAALLGLRRAGFFGRVLEVRVEMGRWIHDGFTFPGQRPSWNYRKAQGGGLILDMFPHWRDFVARVSRRLRSGDLASPLREANVLWTPEVKHLVQRFDSNRDLDRSARVGA